MYNCYVFWIRVDYFLFLDFCAIIMIFCSVMCLYFCLYVKQFNLNKTVQFLKWWVICLVLIDTKNKYKIVFLTPRIFRMQLFFLKLVVIHALKALGVTHSPIGSISGFKFMQAFIVQWPIFSIEANALMKSSAINKMPCFMMLL